MAKSGNLSTTAHQGRYYKLSWTATQSTVTNKSTISWELEALGGSSSWYAERTVQVVIAGETVYSKSARVERYAGKVASGEITLAHNTDGKKSFSASVKAAVYGQSINCTGSDSFTLDAIPRAASITSANNFNDEGKPTVKYSNPAGSAATVQVGLFWDSTTALIGYTTVSGTSGTKEFTLTDAQQKAIWSKLANKKTATIYYYIKTTIGDYTNTSRVAKTVSIVNATPTLSPLVQEDTNQNTDGGDGEGNIIAAGVSRIIKGISDIRYDFNASAKKGASIKSYSVVCGSKTGSSSSGVLFNVESGTIKFTVTDSRGNTATETVTGTLVNYVKLTCNLKASMALNTSTTAKATIKINGNFFNGNLNTSTKNVLELWYRYKPEDGDYSDWIVITPTISGNTYSINFTAPESFDYQKAYTFQARARDDLHRAYNNYKTSNEVVASALPIFDWSKNDFNFNVPVRFRNGGLAIQGTNTDGEIVTAFQPCNTNDNCVIGYGNYGKGIGGTNIYGDTVRLISNKSVTVNGAAIAENKILWSGAYYMTEGQTANLSENISAQATGIVLVFSRYDVDSSTALDQHWSYHFVPKAMVNLMGSGGSIFSMTTSNETLASSKYLYINNGSIKGHANNDANGTGNNGIVYNNNRFVLRYVIGV
mgnify:CR=1 FL=1